MTPTKKGQLVRFAAPKPDKDPKQVYVLLDSPADAMAHSLLLQSAGMHQLPRVDIMAVTDDRFRPISTVTLSDLTAVEWPTVEALARTFANNITEYLTEMEMQAINLLNAQPAYAGCCASGDFCDSNVFMAEAFKALTGVEPDETNHAMSGRNAPGMDDAVGKLWNAAWTMAKENRFWV